MRAFYYLFDAKSWPYVFENVWYNEVMKAKKRLPYVWDYEMDEPEFQAILSGEVVNGRLGQEWAAVRLLEYAPYEEIVQRLGFRALIEGWPTWRDKIRADNRKRGFDFLVEWLPVHHPELV